MIHSIATRFVVLPLLSVALWSPLAWAQTREDQIVRNSTAVLDEIMAIPARRVPQRLLASAQGVAIIPSVVKGGFVVGVRHGRGVMLIRGANGQWQPPAFMSITGGSVGWQAGIQSTDVILVFRTRKSVDNLMQGKLTIGVDAAGAAGPVGRQASAATDARLSAEILSYSRSRGLFAGVSFDGSVLQIDRASDMAFYRTNVGAPPTTPTAIPESAIQLMNRLTQYSGGVPVQQATPPGVQVPPAQLPAPQPQLQAVTASQMAETVRLQLVHSWQQLSSLLDAKWAAYLAPPQELMQPGGGVNIEALNSTLQRYVTVTNNPEFAALAGRPEFATTHQLLREYVTLKSASASRALALPPPPSHDAAPHAGRY